jgi:hypothetical protein
MGFLTWLQTRAAMYFSIVVALVVTALKIRQSGKDAERNKSLEATLKAVQKKGEVKNEVDRLPSGSAADRLRDKWSRD